MELPHHRFHQDSPDVLWLDSHNTWPLIEHWQDGFDLIDYDMSRIDARLLGIEYLPAGVKYKFIAGKYRITIWE